MRDELTKDLEAMEEAMCRTADRCDIWQDRVIYAICKAVHHIILYLLRDGLNHTKTPDKEGEAQ